MDDNEEDWFYDSISRYKNLNMFEMEYPVHHVELASSNSICASCSDNKQHQLLELNLPLKLTSQANKSLGKAVKPTNDTDLKIRCGTFTSSRIAHMRNCKSDRMVVASHHSKNSISFYKLSTDDSDEIKNTLMTNSELKNPFLAVNDSLVVLTKTSASPVFFLDVKTGKVISSTSCSDIGSSEDLVSPAYLDAKVIALCNHSSGTIQLCDNRDSKVMNTNMAPGEENSTWSFCALFESSLTSDNNILTTSLARVSNKGVLQVFDSRNWSLPYLSARLELKHTKSAQFQIRFKPSNKGWISVSGFDGNVYVYKLESEPEQVFVHDGHRHVEGFTSDTLTSSHLWFPDIDNVIISSADNGTIQSWQFEDSVKLIPD